MATDTDSEAPIVGLAVAAVVVLLLGLLFWKKGWCEALCCCRSNEKEDGGNGLSEPLISDHRPGSGPSQAVAVGDAGRPEPSAPAGDVEHGKLPPTAIEGTNLAGIGSAEDKAAREAAARMEFHWQGGVGSAPGVEIWRVENRRTDDDKPDFGIAAWPRNKYGQFHRGDSYIVLATTKDPDGDKLLWDIHFWIGSQSTQDEYGVAAYKATELDDLLGGDPMQHREVEGHESPQFVRCFPRGITYLEGGVDSGFRKVADLGDSLAEVRRLYRVVKRGQSTRCFEVPLERSSLNDGDAFLLDAGHTIYTWFGSSVSAFERSKSAEVAHNLREGRLGDCRCLLDVGDGDDEFWELLGGRGEIAPAAEDGAGPAAPTERNMFVLSDAEGYVATTEVPLSRSNLASDDVCIVDAGGDVYVWIGGGSTREEKVQAMIISYRYLEAQGRHESTGIHRVLEGQEAGCKPFLAVFE